jgi:MFS family permease
MTTLLLLTALVAAARGLWSPCGMSMLSSLNPVSERSRGHRFWVTALWYVAGATAGGAALGGVLAAAAFGFGALGLPATVLWTLALAAAAAAVASDLRLGGWSLPVHPRQVDERWLTSYRRWIYAGGYGVQIGTGFATYIMSAAVYLTAVLAALTGRPGVALLGGLVFGFVRGLGIALAATARDPERLRTLLARVDAAAAPSVLLAALAQAGIATAAAWVVAGPLPAAGTAAVLGTAVAARVGRRAVVPS